MIANIPIFMLILLAFGMLLSARYFPATSSVCLFRFLPTYEDEEEAQNEVANIADDAVEGGEGESAGDAPWMTAKGVVVAEILVPADV